MLQPHGTQYEDDPLSGRERSALFLTLNDRNRLKPQPEAAAAVVASEYLALRQENGVLLGICLVALVLLGPLFTAGYFFGRLTTPASPILKASAGQSHTNASVTIVPAAPAAAPQPEPPIISPIQKPTLHGTYLQVSATRKSQWFTDRLRENGFNAVAWEIPRNPGMYRILVGPVEEGTLAQIRRQLENKGLPGQSAIPWVF